MMDRGDSSNHTFAGVEEQLFALPAIQSTPAGAECRFLRMNGADRSASARAPPHAVRDLATALYGDTIKKQ